MTHSSPDSEDDLDSGTIARNLRCLESRMQYRVEAIEARDGDGEPAITGPGVGIGYLLAKDLTDALGEAATFIEGVSTPAQAAGEPVAWQIMDKYGRWITMPGDWSEKENVKGYTYRPLYAEAPAGPHAVDVLRSVRAEINLSKAPKLAAKIDDALASVMSTPPQPVPAAEEFAKLAESHVQMYPDNPSYDEACRDIAKAIRDAAPGTLPQTASLREALQEAIDVFDGMNDDEINEELLPRLRAALSRPE